MNLPFYISNVFAESAWGGNPLAIVPLLDGQSLDTATMQRIARQFNLSETVFITPPTATNHTPNHAAHLRIFTPEHEMPFAGHPTIGAAQWLHSHLNLSDTFTLTTPAKTATITHENGVYRFALSGYESAPCSLSREHLAQALGLDLGDVANGYQWMNAGTRQLIVPLTSRDAVMRAKPINAEALLDARVDAAHVNVYLWHENNGAVTSRYFFSLGQSLIEDPGTGSACANLGAWAHEAGFAPVSWKITQAEAIERPNHLYLNVSEEGAIQVGGRVMPFAHGELHIF